MLRFKKIYHRRHYNKAMPFVIDLIIPGYKKAYPRGIFKTLALQNQSSKDWYDDFTDLLFSAIGNRFLPVTRLSDGEFIFCMGKKLPIIKKPTETYLHYFLRRLRSVIVKLLRLHSQSNRMDVNSGLYSSDEWNDLRPKYAMMLKRIAERGVLAVHFSYRSKPFVQQYFHPVMNWFESNQIYLSHDNYFPFYFVYALVNNASESHLVAGRRILIVTHLDSDKIRWVSEGMNALGAIQVSFVDISEKRSLLDKIDVSKYIGKIDVSFVAAGIGSPNILLQLEPLNTLCIDVGFALKTMSDPCFRTNPRKTRSFCWPDSERNGNYTTI